MLNEGKKLNTKTMTKFFGEWLSQSLDDLYDDMLYEAYRKFSSVDKDVVAEQLVGAINDLKRKNKIKQKDKTMNRILELTMLFSAVIGSLLITSTITSYQILAFVSWILANLVGIVFAYRNKHKILVIQYLFFLSTSIYGLVVRI